MRSIRLTTALLAPVLLLSACASEPLGPTIPVMPAPNKPFDVFQGDQALCKQFAADQVGGGAQQSNDQQFGTAVLGTLLGAGLGAALGGGRGAAMGAGVGALGGTAIGAGGGQQAQYSLQQRYDMAYAQCMYSRGNQVPGYRQAPPPGYQQAPPPRYQQAPAGYAPPPGYQQPPQGYQQAPPQGYQQPPPGYQPPPPGYQPPPSGY